MSDVFVKVRWVIGELLRVVTVKGMTTGEKKSEDVISRTLILLSRDRIALVKLLNLRPARGTP